MISKQKQVCDMKAGKRMTVAQSNEHLRVGNSSAWKAKVVGSLDPSRTHLNFEIGKGGVVMEVDQKTSITKRIESILSSHNISDPNRGISDEKLLQKRIGVRTHANFILEGSRETLRRLAFGDQQVNYEQEADNSHITRSPEIEKWALDMYNFMANKYGESNIAAFVAHLDESLPHIHCTIVPITQTGKLSYKDVFAGENKYEFSRRTKQLHDELAEVNKKWGLERGDSVAVTGAQHKSYLGWMREQIIKNWGVIDDQNETITQNNGTIFQQKQELYNINAEIRMAEKKKKGLSTMIENLEKEQDRLMGEIVDLDCEFEASDDKLEKKRQEINKQIAEIEDKIADKRAKLAEATELLEKLGKKRDAMRCEYEQLKDAVEEKQDDNFLLSSNKIGSVMWRDTVQRMKDKRTAWESFADRLPYDLRNEFEDLLQVTTLEDMFERGNEAVGVACALYMGYVKEAISFAHDSGGGSSCPDSDWGRKKDEDDETYARRCCIMGRMMMRPPKTRYNRGFHR